MNTDQTQIQQEMSAEASRIEEDSLYSARSNFEASRVWGWFHTALGLPIAIVSAISGISVIKESYYLAIWLAFSVAILTAISSFLNVAKRQQEHKHYGSLFLSLRNDARLYKNIGISSANTTQEATKILEELNKTRNRLTSESPAIPRWAYEMAKRNIERGEAKHRDG